MSRNGHPTHLKIKAASAPAIQLTGSAKFEQVTIGIRVEVRLSDQAFQREGLTLSVGPEYIRLTTNYAMCPEAPVSLQFRLGAGLCYLNVAGHVTSCVPSETCLAYKYQAGIELIAMCDFEQRMLRSVLEEIRHDELIRGTALLTIEGNDETLTNETTGLPKGRVGSPRCFRREPRAKSNDGTAGVDPVWIVEMKQELKPYWDAVLKSRIVQEASSGTLSLPQMRGWLIQLYPFIETFPKWIALTIARASDDKTRAFMIDNIRIEKRHAAQWVHMAQAFGITESEIFSVRTIPEVDAVTHWLWSINSWGSLAEGVAATNYAVEGVTQGIAKLTVKGFPHYAKMRGINLDKRAYAWMVNHARYDDMHPLQALEVMKLYTTPDLQEKVIFAARRSLEYLFMALDACYAKYAVERA